MTLWPWKLLRQARADLAQARETIDALRAHIERLIAERDALKQQVADVRAEAARERSLRYAVQAVSEANALRPVPAVISTARTPKRDQHVMRAIERARQDRITPDDKEPAA